MEPSTERDLVRTLLAKYGRTYATEAGIRVERNIPSALFQLLVLSLLLSARIAARNATRACRALLEAGLTTPQKMCDATWQQRVDVITWHGYKRYDERTATMLGDSARLVLDEYSGDLRRLRQNADGDTGRAHALLKQFSGIGDTGADIFLREVQGAWPEVYPFADDRVLATARRLGLGGSPKALARLVRKQDFARFTSALIRADLGKAYDDLRAPSTGRRQMRQR